MYKEMEQSLQQMTELLLGKMEELQRAQAAQIAANQEEMKADINAQAKAHQDEVDAEAKACQDKADAEAKAHQDKRMPRHIPTRNNSKQT
jgi:hypothetical protein